MLYDETKDQNLANIGLSFYARPVLKMDQDCILDQESAPMTKEQLYNTV